MRSCPLRCISSGSAFTPAEPEQSLDTLGRWVRCFNPDSDTECQCIGASPLIRFCSRSGSDACVTLPDLAASIGFTYTAHVMFESDCDIRGMHLWQPGACWHGSISLDPSLHKAVTLCQPHPRLCVRFINDSMGYGLFADAPLPAGSLVCEYTGVMRTRPSSSAYAVSPPPYPHPAHLLPQLLTTRRRAHSPARLFALTYTPSGHVPRPQWP